MAKIKTSELVPGYFLSKAVINDDFQTLLYEGTKIVASDIEMLKSEGIEYVYVFSDNVNKISKKEKEIITLLINIRYFKNIIWSTFQSITNLINHLKFNA